MYYQIKIKLKTNRFVAQYDQEISEDEIIKKYIKPQQEDTDIIIDNFLFKKNDIEEFFIKKTSESVKNKYQELKINFYSLEEKYNKDCLHYTATKNLYKNSSPPKKPKELNSFPEEEDGAFELLKNETNLLSELIEKYKAQTLENKNEITAPLKNGVKKKKLEIKTNNKVFIVHGHDKEMELNVAKFIKQLELEAIILHEQASAGDTIIEKIEKHTDVGYGIVLYSPCDKGKGKDEETLKDRARQNVVFEHGYLMGKLGRDRVIALNKNNVEVPSDITGIVYVPYDNHGGWQMTIAKEMKNKGFEIDLNNL